MAEQLGEIPCLGFDGDDHRVWVRVAIVKCRQADVRSSVDYQRPRASLDNRVIPRADVGISDKIARVVVQPVEDLEKHREIAAVGSSPQLALASVSPAKDDHAP